MTESVVVEIFENQIHLSMKGWIEDRKTPYSLKRDNSPCKPLEEFSLPGSEWSWASNWRIDKKPGLTDDDGWEYA
jgi:hypothetical protein